MMLENETKEAVTQTTLARWLKMIDQGHYLNVAGEIRNILAAAAEAEERSDA